MKLTKQQKKRIDKLATKYKGLIKGRAKVTRDKLRIEWKLKKFELLESFKFQDETKKEANRVKLQKKRAIIEGKPYLSKEIASGSFDIWEIPHKQKILANRERIDNFVKRQISLTKKKIRYIHIIVEYKDLTFGMNSVMSDSYTLFFVNEVFKRGESIFDTLFNKYQTVARAKESDFQIDKVNHILIKFIYEPQTNETSRGEEKNS